MVLLPFPAIALLSLTHICIFAHIIITSNSTHQEAFVQTIFAIKIENLWFSIPNLGLEDSGHLQIHVQPSSTCCFGPLLCPNILIKIDIFRFTPPPPPHTHTHNARDKTKSNQ